MADKKKWMAAAKGCTGPIADTPEQAALLFFEAYPAWRKKTVIVRGGTTIEPGIFVSGLASDVHHDVTFEMAKAGLSKKDA